MTVGLALPLRWNKGNPRAREPLVRKKAAGDPLREARIDTQDGGNVPRGNAGVSMVVGEGRDVPDNAMDERNRANTGDASRYADGWSDSAGTIGIAIDEYLIDPEASLTNPARIDELDSDNIDSAVVPTDRSVVDDAPQKTAAEGSQFDIDDDGAVHAVRSQDEQNDSNARVRNDVVAKEGTTDLEDDSERRSRIDEARASVPEALEASENIAIEDLERSWGEYFHAIPFDEHGRTNGDLFELPPPPLLGEEIAERTSENRIDLADNVPDVAYVREYGGYLDVVMHGDANGTQANVDGRFEDFTLDETASLIMESPAWKDRPIRLMSCSTGQGSYAQDLSDKLGIVVYAPTDVLSVFRDGSKVVGGVGSWRRFEPRVR